MVAAPEHAALEVGISEAARMVGVSAATLRAWEREGLIQPVRTAAGYRRFSIGDVEQLRRVRNLRDVQDSPLVRIDYGCVFRTAGRSAPWISS